MSSPLWVGLIRAINGTGVSLAPWCEIRALEGGQARVIGHLCRLAVRRHEDHCYMCIDGRGLLGLRGCWRAQGGVVAFPDTFRFEWLARYQLNGNAKGWRS
jgi:hypothetical protein